jgi:type IV pilus assembly protein PilB
LRKRLGELLVESGLISLDELNIALANQKESKKKLGEIIVDLKMASEMDIAQTLASELGIPYLEMSKAVVEPMAVGMVSEELARKHALLPLSIDGKILTVAMMDPLDFEAVDDVRFSSGYKVKPVVTTKTDLLDAIDLHYKTSESVTEILLKDLRQEKALVEIVHEREGVDVETLRKKSETPPIIRMVNLMIGDAVKSRASDIHIEPQERRVLIRDRIDGLLQDIMELPKWVQGAIVSRVKIMARLDIAEKRVPQDGRVKIKVDGKEIDLRVSTLPTQYGEKVVMRLLDTKGAAVPMEELGFYKDDLEKVISFISKPQGVILVTGPTGSGKTSTLYAAINRLKSERLNIITLEDPIEFEIKGVNQVMINEKVGLTFANGLRSILRQDPNIMMVGEMRDLETAEIAIQASLTGHLVLSTLHTNDATSSIIRLLDLGIKPYLIASSLNGVIAQRLVRVLCPHCKERYTPSREDLLSIRMREAERPPFDFYRGKGCEHCKKTGYIGRTGIFEVFPVTTKIREMIASRATEIQIRQTAIAEGLRTLGEDALDKIRMGVTSIEELRRVVYLEGESTSICSACGRTISADFPVCPFCGHSVSTLCPSCGRHRDPEWIVCPYCKSSLT